MKPSSPQGPVGRIRKIALDILELRPEGVRYSELVHAIKARDGSLNFNTILGPVWVQRGAGGSSRPGDPPAGTFRGSSWDFGGWAEYTPPSSQP